MRKFQGVLIALFLVLLAAPAMAALDQSHHDMPNYNTSTTNKDKCFWCHGIKDTNTGATLEANYGKVGAFCVTRCHQGGSALGGSGGGIVPQAPNVNGGSGDTWSRPAASFSILAFTSAHGDNTSKSFYGSSAASTVSTSGLPYAAGAKLECTSCHSVHDNQNSPFLWAPLQGATAGTGLCDKCHPERAGNNLSGAPNGNHPVDFVVNYAAALARTETLSAPAINRHGRTISFDWSSATAGAGVFDVVTPNGTGLNGTQGTAEYRTGGHLGNFGQASGGTAQMGCYTCHSAHQPGGTQNNLVVTTYADINNGFNPICMGCHGAATTWAGNATDNSVGSNSPAYYGHPYGTGTGYVSLASGVATYRVSVGGFTFTLPFDTVEAANTQNGIQFGAAGELMCSTCHDVHLGTANSKAIANLGQASGTAVCMACHNGSELADVQDIGEGGVGEPANSHHRTTTTAVTASYKPGTDGQTLGINLAWITVGPQKIGDLTDGLQCADCHQFNYTAHNW